VVSRGSTEALCLENDQVVRALRFIRDHAHEGIRVPDVCRAAGIGRKTLENHFRKTLGRAPFQEIRRVQIEHAKQILRDSVLKLDWIADRCGFNSGIHLSHEFRRHTGMTPNSYRKLYRN